MGALVEIPMCFTAVTYDETRPLFALLHKGEAHSRPLFQQFVAGANQALVLSHVWSLAKLSKQASGA